MLLLVQDGVVEGCVLISSYKSTRITASCSTANDRRTLEPTKKDTPHPNRKKRSQWVGKMVGGTVTIKSNPVSARWVTHRLENSNTKEVPPLL